MIQMGLGKEQSLVVMQHVGLVVDHVHACPILVV